MVVSLFVHLYMFVTSCAQYKHKAQSLVVHSWSQHPENPTHSARLVPKVSTYHTRHTGLLTSRVRCTALNTDLNGKVGGWHSHEHTEALTDALDVKVLWVDYGIVSSIMVHLILFPWFFLWCNSKPFTHGFPRANIHKLLSPNILHQMIKGTFKDHLVAWVVSYVKLVNTLQHAKKVLADIDRWYVS